MPKKTSKTAHVLNLLSPTIEEEIIADAPETEWLSENKTPMQNMLGSSEVLPEKSDSMEDILHMSNSNDELSMLIKGNLEKEFIESTGNTDELQELEEPEDSEESENVEDTENSENSELLEDGKTAVFTNTPVENTEQEEDLSHNMDNSDMIQSIENMLLDEHISQEKEGLPIDENTTQDEDLSDHIADILANTNMVHSIENVFAEENTIQKEDENAADSSHISDSKENEESSDDEEVVENTPFYYTNIFEYIVKDCALEYMERFGLCTCDRCIADVTALALTNLPPKYMVTDYGNVAPLIHYLEHKHEVILMTEMTKACLTVYAAPRHTIKKVKTTHKTI